MRSSKTNLFQPVTAKTNDKECEIFATDSAQFFLYADGSLYAMGSNSKHELGLEADQITVPTKVVMPENRRITKVIPVHGATFVIDTSGNWYGMGNNFKGQLGLGEGEIIKTPTIISLPDNKKIQKALKGNGFTIYESTDHKWYGCGANARGELGLGDKQPRYVPTEIKLPNDLAIQDIIVADDSIFIITPDRRVFACGDNSAGKLGQPPYIKRQNPSDPSEGPAIHPEVYPDTDEPDYSKAFIDNTAILSPTEMKLSVDTYEVDKIQSDNVRTYFFINDDELYACGLNENGELGVGNFKSIARPAPIILPRDEVVEAVYPLVGKTLILSDEGNLYGCGRNMSEVDLTKKEREQCDSPTLIQFPTHVAINEVLCFEDAQFYLTQQGEVYASGVNQCGELGVGEVHEQLQPTLVVFPENVRITDIVHINGRSTFFITNNNDCYATGVNYLGRLGVGVESENVLTPLRVMLPGKVTNIYPEFSRTLFSNDGNKLYLAGASFKEGNEFHSKPVEVNTEELKTLNQSSERKFTMRS